MNTFGKPGNSHRKGERRQCQRRHDDRTSFDRAKDDALAVLAGYGVDFIRHYLF